MSKRRVFDIEYPGNTAPAEPSPGFGEPRRGPMATAISENAEALDVRERTQAAIRVENDALAHELVRLKKLGLIVDLVPVDEIFTQKLMRDRSTKRDPDLDELKASIRAVGLSNPIRVEQDENGYELVQGYRRLAAYRELLSETGDPAYARIPVGLMARGETLELLYRRMIDENLIRRDVSFAEMADLARNYAKDLGAGTDDIDTAINILFASASRQKRSYIRHFATLLDNVGDLLKFPEAVPRSLGLQLEKRLSGDPGFPAMLRTGLKRRSPETAEDEVAFLKDAAAARVVERPRDNPVQAQAKTTLRFRGPSGMVRCLATEGRIVMQAERDFSSLDRTQLESALDAFFRALDGEFNENADYAPKLKK